MTSTNPGNYLGNIVSAVAGREGFDPTHPDSPALIRYSVITLILYLVFILVFSYGAAKLSYAYNVSIGTSSGMTTLYSVLSFFLSSLYLLNAVLNLVLENHGIIDTVASSR